MEASHNNKKGLVDGLWWLAEKIKGLCGWVEALPGKGPELFAIALYAVAHLLMAIVHEPWYDEAVAWQIARCASLKDILFQIPHYEGHPPLWHLILLPFAKLGAPYELSLSIVSLIFAGGAVALIIWKAPFPRLVRLLVPFTYFFFYQYGVVTRPYCVMMLAFVLLAICYCSRNEQPGRYVLCLALLCLTSAYGILMAGGLALVWVWEIWHFQNVGKFLRSFASDKRIWWLAGLLLLAVLLILEIMPREDTYAIGHSRDLNDPSAFIRSLIFMVLAMPAEVTITSAYNQYTILQYANIPASTMMAACFLGIVLWTIALVIGHKKGTLGALVIPLLMFDTFAAFVYISPHHFGIGLLYIVFWLWISLASEDKSKDLLCRFNEKDRSTLSGCAVLVCSAAMVVSLCWSGKAIVTDINESNASGRYEAAFIKEHGLDNYRIMIGWTVYYDEEGEVTGMNTNLVQGADNIAPYFEHNLFFNFNDGDDRRNYTSHRRATEKENERRLAEWATEPPDVLYMGPALELVYDEEVACKDDYILVFSDANGTMWKGETYGTCSGIYVRKELAEELGLEELDSLEYHGWSTAPVKDQQDS